MLTKQCTNPKCSRVKPLTEFYKDVKAKDGRTSRCKSCYVSYNTGRKQEKAIYDAINYENNNKEILAKQALHYFENREIKIIKQKEYTLNHKQEKALYDATYSKANPGKVNAKCNKRRAAKLYATPPWLTKEQLLEMENIYIECARITEKTGIPHEVDHIIPLQGKNVCGLHVPWNLQILPAKGSDGNRSKGNRIKM